MKKEIILVMLMVMFTGCTSMTYITKEGNTVKIRRFFTNAEIGNMKVNVSRDKDGVETKIIELEGYKSNPNSEAMKSFAEGMAKGLIKGVKP